MDDSGYIQDIDCERALRPDGEMEVRQAPGVWTLAHRGYGGGRALGVWAYPSEEDACRAGAVLALDCLGVIEDPTGRELFDAGRYRDVLDWYERRGPEWVLLRVQSAFLSEPVTADV